MLTWNQILCGVSLGAVFQGGWEVNTSNVTGIIVAIIVLVCIVLGVVGAILMNRLALLVVRAYFFF